MEPQMTALEILKTDNYEYEGTKYTIRLTRNKSDNQDYSFIVKNENSVQTKKYNFTEEVALDCLKQCGESLFDVLPEIIKGDIKNGII